MGVPAPIGTWLGAAFGCNGFRHYDAFRGDRPDSTVVIFVSEDIVWRGFSIDRQEFRGRNCKAALDVRRLHDAVTIGWNLDHTVLAGGKPRTSSLSLCNQIKADLTRIRDKCSFAQIWRTTLAA